MCLRVLSVFCACMYYALMGTHNECLNMFTFFVYLVAAAHAPIAENIFLKMVG